MQVTFASGEADGVPVYASSAVLTICCTARLHGHTGCTCTARLHAHNSGCATIDVYAFLACRYVYRVALEPGQRLRRVVPTSPADVERLTRLLADEDWHC